MRLQPIVTACLVAGITLLLYAFRLSAPPLTVQEALFNNVARSIDVRTAPLFVHVRDEQWLQPVAVYANAAVQAVGGGEMSGRIASAIVGALNVAFVFLIARLITGRTWVGLLAALVLMLTPAHWSLARHGSDALFPVAFVLLWLWNLLHFLKWDAMRSLAVAAAWLGLSAYSHPAAPLTAVFLWLLTLITLRRRNRARLAVSTAFFGATWLPAAVWFFLHPTTYPDTFGRWFVFAAHLRNPFDGMRAFINPNTLGTRASLYWGFWDPSWLFFTVRDAAAPLLMVAAPLIALGVFRSVRHVARDTAVLLIGTALVVPLAGATFGVPHYLADAAGVLPILAVLAALGAEQLVALVVRRPIETDRLEDDVAVRAVDGWNGDYLPPRA